MYFVKFSDLLLIWEDLVVVGLIVWEVCGNIVCNIMAFFIVGIDLEEFFDVVFYV